MLSERLIDAGFRVDSLNTDGITTIVKKDRLEEYYAICKEWELETNLELEFNNYYKTIRRDVNTYFAWYADKDGKPLYDKKGEPYVKEKGDFLTTLDMTKGYDKPIVAKVLKAYFTKGTPLMEFLKSHDDIYDFCMMQKMSSQFYAIHNNQRLQKTNRFYASSDPNQGYLKKVKKEDKSEGHICKDSGVTIFNDFVKLPITDYKINYNYYLRNADNIRQLIEPAQLSLF